MDRLDALLTDLVSINSVNPDLVPGSPGEAEIARFISAWLKKAGLEVQVIESGPGRPNVVGIARGRGSASKGQGKGNTLLLNGHMDTVGLGEMQSPLKPFIKDGRLYGRGAYDMKGGLAACMVAVADAKKHALHGDVIFTAVVDEEYASSGTVSLATRFPADGAIVAEFTELQTILAHKGFAWFEIETLGRAAHGSRPDLGVDAIAHMGRVLAELEKLDKNLRSQPGHRLLGTGSVHASIIKGGRELSSYPDHCLLSIERRTLPGETALTVEAEILGIVRDLKRADDSFNAVVHRGIDRSPLETTDDKAVVKALQTAAAKTLGHAPQVAGVPFWTDAAILSAAGIPSLLFGPSGSGAHAVEEWVDLQSVHACADIYLATAIDFCG